MAQISFRSIINLWEMRLIIWFESLLTTHKGPTGRSYELFSTDIVAHHLILWITAVYCPTIKINTRNGYPLAVIDMLFINTYIPWNGRLWIQAESEHWRDWWMFVGHLAIIVWYRTTGQVVYGPSGPSISRNWVRLVNALITIYIKFA